MAVPENRTRAWTADNTVRLAVAILRAPRDRDDAPPTFLLGGGPGQGVIGLFDDLILRYQRLVRHGLAAEEYPGQRRDAEQFRHVMDLLVADLSKRALVLFDQRGAGYSEPSLRCGDESWTACRRRLVSAGADLAAYNTAENASDVRDIARALGFTRVNLQGGSYGTRLALEVMRLDPALVRAAVLDGVAPPQVSWPVEMARRYGDALSVLFDHCREDAACSEAFPDLEARFYRLVQRLEARPIRVRVREVDRAVDGDDLHNIVWNSLYDVQRIRFLPRMIAGLDEGDPTALVRLLQSWSSGEIAWGMHYSVDCAERWVVTRPQDVADAAGSLHPALRAGVIREFTSTYPICRDWDVPPASQLSRAPVDSTVPTLLLSGEFDPGTPPAFGEIAARTLARSHHVVLPYEGHTDGFVGVCHSSLISAFLDDPSRKPDTGCVERMQAAPFFVD